MAGDGHEIANHSYSHQNLALLTPTSVERELCAPP
jgi:peptidoglycan/xylan/chitin deacetylase (PgdA/CDA1 family)